MGNNILQMLTTSVADSSFGAGVIIFNILLTFVMALAIASVYRITHRGLSYSQTFVITLVAIALITSVAMMVIGNNVTRAFALLGTFSIIRFRTAVKDTKDVSYIFLSLILGIAVGTGNYEIAVIATLMILFIMYVLHFINFGSIRKYDYLLSFTMDTKKAGGDILKESFDQFLKSKTLLTVSAVEDGSKLEYNYNVHLLDVTQIGEFTEALSKLHGVSGVRIYSAKNDVEY